MSKYLALILMATFLLTGCNTMQGIGEDLQTAGGALSKAAEKEQED
jgi:predicted small secreted protein